MQRIDTSGLFEPIELAGHTLPNRFVLPGMQRGWCVDGAPDERLAAYYRRRVDGGVGLIISESVAPDATDLPTAAEEHGAGRAESGFSVEQMVAEYRALRASVIRLWTKACGELGGKEVEDLTRFNEAIDQALTYLSSNKCQKAIDVLEVTARRTAVRHAFKACEGERHEEGSDCVR